MTPTPRQLPLSGVRVLDLTSYLSGPFATWLLAGMGADVIKVERPRAGDPARANPPYLGRNGLRFDAPGDADLSLSILKRGRGKRSVGIDLKHDSGRDLLTRLARRSDVLVENFTPGTMDRLGLGPSSLLSEHPGLVYCSISGFGQDGPYRSRPAFDLVVQALSGSMAITGTPDSVPLRTGVALGDLAAGTLAATGILAALRHRDRTGRGQVLDVSMLDCLLAYVLDEAVDVYAERGMELRTGNRRTRLTPFNSYRAADGHVVICTGGDKHWQALLSAMGDGRQPDPAWAALEGRMADADAVDAFVEAWTSSLPREHVLSRLHTAGVACAPVLTVTELFDDPHVVARAMVDDLPHPDLSPTGVKAAAFPLRFSDTPAHFDRPAPRLGEHTREVLTEVLDLSDERLDELSGQGVL